MLDNIVVVTVAMDLTTAYSGASAHLEAAGVEDGGRRSSCAGTAGEGVFHLTKVERLRARGSCEEAEDSLPGACVLPIKPHHSVVGLVVVLELLAESDCLGTRNATESSDS